MPGLLPAELWEYKFTDLVRGLVATLGQRRVSNRTEALDIAGLGKCLPTRSARSAIVVALKALNLAPGSIIGVPLYNCPVVFKAVQAAECTPFFIDVDRETYCMSPEDLASKISRLDAVIAVHMFGNVCDMPALLEAAQGKPIIEDCAQSIGSKLNGRAAGAFGDIAIFSFRSGKYLSVGEGGAVFSSRAEADSRLSSLISGMPVPSLIDECLHSAKTYLRSMLRSRPLWGLVGSRIWSFYNRNTDFEEKTPISASQIYRSDFAIARERLPWLDRVIEKHRANADFFSRTLELDPDMLCSEKDETFYNRYLYPIIFTSVEDRDSIADYLLRAKIGTIKPYQDIVEVAAEHYGYKGGCPVTEYVSKRLLVIPSYYSLKKEEVKRIAQCLNAGWSAISQGDHDN